MLGAFRQAHLAGANVEIVYHAKADDTGIKNDKAIDAAQIKGLCKPRVNADLMHNKFIVLLQNGAPVSVWTGSTNFSRNALHGQLNVGHAIHDAALAQQFLAYWTELRADPDDDTLKDRIDIINPLPPPTDTDAYTAGLFAPPRPVGLRLVARLRQPEEAAVHDVPVRDREGLPARVRQERQDPALRAPRQVRQRRDQGVEGGRDRRHQRIRRFPNIGLALGNRIFVDWIDGWHEEGSGIGVNVNWIHTKFMLIDPLGTKPVTLTGSANWSVPSVTDNDENVLVIRGDKRVADIYFGEFMRLFAHHRFRESVKRHLDEIQGSPAASTMTESEATASGARRTCSRTGRTGACPVKPGSEHDLKRRYFAGSQREA